MLKAAAVALLSVVPAGGHLAAVARKHVTRSLQLSQRAARAKFARTARHLRHFAEAHGAGVGPPERGMVALELGTGWHPVAPVSAFLLGVDHVFTVDIMAHLGWGEVQSTLLTLRDLARRGEIDALPSRVARLDDALARTNLDEALAEVGVSRFVGDARRVSFPRPVDLVFSNNTLEHIPSPTIAEMFQHFHQVGSPRAVMSHWIDMSDHYSEFDPRIGPYHFLRFSAQGFRLINGPVHYQNRLRHSDYVRLHRDNGWLITLDEPTRGARSELRRIPIAPEFARYDEDDLLVYETWTASRRA